MKRQKNIKYRQESHSQPKRQAIKVCRPLQQTPTWKKVASKFGGHYSKLTSIEKTGFKVWRPVLHEDTFCTVWVHCHFGRLGFYQVYKSGDKNTTLINWERQGAETDRLKRQLIFNTQSVDISGRNRQTEMETARHTVWGGGDFQGFCLFCFVFCFLLLDCTVPTCKHTSISSSIFQAACHSWRSSMTGQC